MVRYKNRYFAVEIEPKSGPSHAPLAIRKTALYTTILNKVQQMHGDFGSAAMTNGFATKYCNPYTKIAMIRTRHGPHRFVASILPLITEIDKVKVRFNVLYVGATMAKCFKFIRSHQQRKLEQIWSKMKTDEDRMKMKKALMNFNDTVTGK